MKNSRRKIETAKAAPAIGAYSQAICFDNLVITSGQIPFTPNGECIGEDIGEQTKQCMRNIQNILQEAGSGLEKLIKCTIFITDMHEFPKVNEVYKSYLSEPYPARSCVEVSKLPKDVKVEIEAIASLE